MSYLFQKNNIKLGQLEVWNPTKCFGLCVELALYFFYQFLQVIFLPISFSENENHI